ncbi:hypothetical protein ACP70R_024265 [Stipagrostis hirtigluma subsp. patula]
MRFQSRPGSSRASELRPRDPSARGSGKAAASASSPTVSAFSSLGGRGDPSAAPASTGSAAAYAWPICLEAFKDEACLEAFKDEACLDTCFRRFFLCPLCQSENLSYMVLMANHLSGDAYIKNPGREMGHVWGAVQWWDDSQLRILVLGSLCIQWFLLFAAPMRKYIIPPFFKTIIWLAYISSDALAIYALATLFNRHVRATTAANCGGSGNEASRLEVLWAPILLIHLGGQEALTVYNIEDNELWMRQAATVVTQVTVALYAFYKTSPSWNVSKDWRLLASAILLFIIGVFNFIEKPFALRRASINRLGVVSAKIQGTKKPEKGVTSWLHGTFGLILADYFFLEGCNCFTKSEKKSSSQEEAKKEPLSDADKVYMVLSDMSLSAAADDLVKRGKAKSVEDVLQPLSPSAERGVKRWLLGAFGLIYTRSNMVWNPMYLAYHVILAPILYIAALVLFATSDKHGYSRADVKTTYILLCLTASLDVFAVFIRQLLYMVLSASNVAALCERVPSYNLTDTVLRRRNKDIGWLLKCATRMGYKEGCFVCKGDDKELYKTVSGMVLPDLVKAQGRNLADYRIFTEPPPAPKSEQQQPQHVVEERGPDSEILMSPGNSRSFFPDHNSAASADEQLHHAQAFGDTVCTEILPMVSPGKVSSGSWSFVTKHNQAAPAPSGEHLQHADAFASKSRNWALNEELQKVCGPEIRSSLRGSFDRSVLIWHIATDLCYRRQMQDDHQQQEPPPSPGGGWHKAKGKTRGISSDNPSLRITCAQAISNYMLHLLNFHPSMLMTGSRRHLVNEAMDEFESILHLYMVDNSGKPPGPGDLKKIIEEGAGVRFHIPIGKAADEEVQSFLYVPEACRLAKELLALDVSTRWRVMYRVWLGMLFYSASMCRGYLHAKSLGEGGEFLSFVWLVLSLKGANTLADKLQMLEQDKETTPDGAASSSAPQPRKRFDNLRLPQA